MTMQPTREVEWPTVKGHWSLSGTSNDWKHGRWQSTWAQTAPGWRELTGEGAR